MSIVSECAYRDASRSKWFTHARDFSDNPDRLSNRDAGGGVQPSVAWADTIDYGIVVRGEMTLELDDGQKNPLRQGDCIVQNGTRHRWRNPLPEPCLNGLHLDRREARLMKKSAPATGESRLG